MILALPVYKKELESKVFQSFGLAPYILIYNSVTTESEYLDHTEALNETAAGIRAARAIADHGAKILLVPKCGENVEKILRNAEVLIYKSKSGTAKQNIDAFLSDQLDILTEFHFRMRNAEDC